MRAKVSVTLETRLLIEKVDGKGNVTVRLIDGTGVQTLREGDTLVLPLTWNGGQS